MPNKPTNTDIIERIDRLERKVDTVHDYMMFQKGVQSRKKDGSLDWASILKNLGVIVVAATGVITLFLQVILKVLEK